MLRDFHIEVVCHIWYFSSKYFRMHAWVTHSLASEGVKCKCKCKYMMRGLAPMHVCSILHLLDHVSKKVIDITE